jgi:SAM-dependent methyltransferase
MFTTNSFDCVLCNAVFEHDRYFWLTVAEIKRVTRPGGLIVLGAPGYGDRCLIKFWTRKRTADEHPEGRIRYPPHGCLGAVFGRVVALIYSAAVATPTLAIHDYPGDYYRFSVQAFEKVVLDGLENVQVHSILFPPRIVGAGTKKPG